MKNIVIVNKGNNAAAYCEGVEIIKTGTSNISANLMVLNEVLKSVIPTEPCETYRIFLPELIKGINYGYAIEYVKTGKQQDGKDLAPDDLAGYKEFYELYKDRLLNVRFNLVSYIEKMNSPEEVKVLKALRVKSYSLLNNVGVAPVVQTVAVDPHKDLRDMLTEQIKEAVLSGDLAKAQTLTDMIAKLGAPQTQTVTAPQQTTSVQTQQEFDLVENQDLDEVEFCSPSETKKTDDEPIVFEETKKTEETNKPNWDNSLAE